MPRPSLVVLFAAIALIGAACSSSGGPTTTAGSSAPGTVAPSAAAPTTAPTGAALATPTAAPTPTSPPVTTDAPASPAGPPGGTGDLAALVPDEVMGMTIQKESFSGPDYVEQASGGNPELIETFTDFFALFDATAEDVSLATGSGFKEGDYVSIEAMRVVGADPETLVAETAQNTIDTAPLFNPGLSASAAPGSVGGRDVTVVTVVLGGSVYQTSYLYATGDTVFTVEGGSEESIADAVSQLP